MKVGRKVIAVGKETKLYITSDGWVYISLQKYTPFIFKVTYLTFLQTAPQSIRFLMEFSSSNFVTGRNRVGMVPMCFVLNADVTATLLAGRTFCQISQPDDNIILCNLMSF